MGDEAELDRVVELYLSGQYEKCGEALGALLEPGAPGAFVERAAIERGRLYFASCAVLSGRSEPARLALRAALEANPLMSPPDSLTFPPPVLALFFEVREEVQSLIAKEEQAQVARLRLENEQARQLAAERDEREKVLLRMALEQPVIVQSSRLVASLPFGAGQYQNGDTALGHTFLISELVLAGTAAVSAGLLLNLYTEAGGGVPQRDIDTFRAAHTTLAISTVGVLTTAALGILEAQLSFRSERQVGIKKRELPTPSAAPPAGATGAEGEGVRSVSDRPTVSWTPYSFPTSDGFQAGFVGTF